MKELRFKNPVFHSGENSTVRRGTRWSGYNSEWENNEAPVMLVDTNLIENGKLIDEPAIGTGTITGTIVKRFCDLSRKDIENSHDPRLRQFPALIKFMGKCYPGFNQNEIVTVVKFVCSEDKKE
jgi:hypothetical protein